jgi:hypothetical protein
MRSASRRERPRFLRLESVHGLRLALVILTALPALTSGGAALSQPPPSAVTRPSSSDEAWRTFEGTWSASGERQVLSTESGGTAAAVHLSGAVVLASGEGLSRGFLGEAIGFDDGRGLSVGRCVFTDEKGDRIFSEIRGEPFQTGKRVTGTITGGTGRYAGLTGDYAFEWQYVVTADDGHVAGRAVKLAGRFKRGPASPGATP